MGRTEPYSTVGLSKGEAGRKGTPGGNVESSTCG